MDRQGTHFSTPDKEVQRQNTRPGSSQQCGCLGPQAQAASLWLWDRRLAPGFMCSVHHSHSPKGPAGIHMVLPCGAFPARGIHSSCKLPWDSSALCWFQGRRGQGHPASFRIGDRISVAVLLYDYSYFSHLHTSSCPADMNSLSGSL